MPINLTSRQALAHSIIEGCLVPSVATHKIDDLVDHSYESMKRGKRKLSIKMQVTKSGVHSFTCK